MSVRKKIAFVLLATLLLITGSLSGFFVKPIRADVTDVIWGTGPWFNQSLGQFYLKVHEEGNENELFGERYTSAQVDWIIWSVLTWPLNKIAPNITYCVLSKDIVDCITRFITTNDVQNKLKYALENNPKQDENILSAVFEERSFSGITYTKNALRNLSIIPSASAQSTGFGFAEALSPIQPFWKAFRDIAYGLMVLVVIAFAFMIMFRVKISPQVVISIQSALPKIISSVILVTFSYAIAGFLIDLMYVVFGLLSVVSMPISKASEPAASFYLMTRGQIIYPFPADIGLGVLGLSAYFLVLFIGTFVFALFTSIGILGTSVAGVATGLAAFIFALTGGSIGMLLAIIAVILALFIIIFIIWHIIKITWMLIKTYANIVLLTIFAPIQFVLGAVVPSLGFGQWLKSYISNLSVFVATGYLFLLSYIFLYQAIYKMWSVLFGGDVIKLIFGGIIGNLLSDQASQDWPPLLIVGSGDQGTALLFLGVSLVLFIIIPKTADIIKSIIEGRPFAYGTAIGEAFGLPLTAGRAAISYHASKTEEGLSAGAGGGPYPVPWWISAARTAGIIRK